MAYQVLHKIVYFLWKYSFIEEEVFWETLAVGCLPHPCRERGGDQLAHFITWTPEAIPGGNDVATNTTGRGHVFLNIWEIITII